MPTLDWIGKKAVVNHHRDVPYRLIHCDRDKSFGDPESGNLLVQGDNLEALKALLPYYAGQVKCIYIDPPYNTGNESWVYNDNVNSPEIRAWLGKVVGKEAEDLSRHDKWLCMMYPRLRLLKEFLREDGSIWISIDDNEVHFLRMICDQIFGAQNFVAVIAWRSSDSSNNDARVFSNDHNYVIVYSANNDWEAHALKRTEEKNAHYKNPDNDPMGAWFSGNVSSPKPRQNLRFIVTSPTGVQIEPPANGWRWKQETITAMIQRGEIIFSPDGRRLIKKTYLVNQKGLSPSSIWHDIDDTGHNRQAKYELKKLFPNILTSELFETPKPEKVIKRILEISTNPNDLVLDSFAGSGTTGAVAHKMGRRHISVEMGEHAHTHIVPRYKKVITGEDQGGISESVNWQGGGGFRYCTLGEPLFDAEGDINAAVSFRDLAAHVFFCETGSPIPRRASGPLIGAYQGRAIYLLYAKDSAGVANARAGNVLNGAMLADLPDPKDPEALRVVYAEGCTLSETRLRKEGVIFKHIPYQIAGA